MVQEVGKKIAVTEEEKEAQRQRILMAAVQVFGKNGYHKSTISEIAKAADMGRGTLYWYFKSKEDLFRSLFAWMHDEWVGALEAEAAQPTGFEQRLRKIVTQWLQSMVDHQELMRIFYAVISETQGDFAVEMHGAVSRMYRSMITILETMFDRAVEEQLMRTADTHRLARLLVSFIDGMLMQHIFVEPVDPEAMTEVVMKLLFKGLKPESKPE